MSDSLFGLGNLVTDSGRTRFSGPSSGLPTQDIIEASLKPQQNRVDTIETTIEENNFKIDAFENLRNRMDELKSAASELNGRRSLSGTTSVFNNKTLGEATTSRFDSQAASDASSIIGAQVESESVVTDHQIEVLQKAQAEKLGGKTFSSASDALVNDLGEVTDGSLAGEFRIGQKTTLSTEASDPTQTIKDLGFADNDFTLNVNGNNINVDVDNDTLNDLATNIDGLGSVSSKVTAENQLRIQATDGNPLSLGDGGSNFVSNAQLQDGGTISTADSDSLNDIRDKINNSDSGVTASVVSISGSEKQLTITSERTGQDFEIVTNQTSNNPLEDLGVVDGSGNQNVLQGAQNTRFTADNIKDQQIALSEQVSDSSQTIQEVGFASEDFTLEVNNGAGTQSVNVDVDTDTLNDLATNLNGKTDINASVTTDNELRVESTNGNLSFDDGASNFLESSNLDETIFERQSNTVDDVFEGVTLNIRKAEDGTTVNLPIQRDLAGAQEAIQNFVDAFNSVRQFVNAQQQDVQIEGQSEDTAGVLADEQALEDIDRTLSQIASGVGRNVEGEYQTLRDVGIQQRQDDEVADPLQAGTLTIRENLDDNDPADRLDTALNKNFESVRNLFEFDFRTSDPAASLLNFENGTSGVDGYQLDVNTDGNGDITSAQFRDDAGNTVSTEITTDNSVKAKDGAISGLSMFFDDPNAGRTVQFDTGLGIGAQSFFRADNAATSQDGGTIQGAINTLESQNESKNDRLVTLERRLEDEREQLQRRFSSLEGTLAQAGRQQQIIQARLGGGGS